MALTTLGCKLCWADVDFTRLEVNQLTTSLQIAAVCDRQFRSRAVLPLNFDPVDSCFAFGVMTGDRAEIFV
jgi:hypothetical protein